LKQILNRKIANSGFCRGLICQARKIHLYQQLTQKATELRLLGMIRSPTKSFWGEAKILTERQRMKYNTISGVIQAL